MALDFISAPFIDLCIANEPRPTNGRPELQGLFSYSRIIIKANINNSDSNSNLHSAACLHFGITSSLFASYRAVSNWNRIYSAPSSAFSPSTSSSALSVLAGSTSRQHSVSRSAMSSRSARHSSIEISGGQSCTNSFTSKISRSKMPEDEPFLLLQIFRGDVLVEIAAEFQQLAGHPNRETFASRGRWENRSRTACGACRRTSAPGRARSS